MYGTIINICECCGNEVNKAQLAKHHPTNKCKTKPHPNDEYINIAGRTYLKGKSPFEGVWHETHIPSDIHEVNKQNQYLTKEGYIYIYIRIR